MHMDRGRQLRILELLANGYPDFVDVRRLWEEDNSVARELIYMAEHRLIEVRRPRSISETMPVAEAKLTARGVDFLQDDGGLSAILGVVTIKIHDETLKQLIAARIEQSELPQPEKQRFLARLRSLPADATRHLVLKLVEKGLDHAPDAVRLLETFLRSP